MCEEEEVVETMTIQEAGRLIDWCRASGLSDTDICDCLKYIATGTSLHALKAISRTATRYDDSEGMTDLQYKGMLLDQLEAWERVLGMFGKAEDTEIREEIERQIAKTNEKLKF